jgi:hypothetical protein
MTVATGATAAGAAPPRLEIRLANLWWVAAAVAAMIAAIVAKDRWALNFVHVMSGILWTGIDLFMGFVLGPVMRGLDMPVRRALVMRLMPRMLFVMPTLSIITGTSGWFLAKQTGYLDVPWPLAAWVWAALAITTILAVQGLGFLLPTNLRVCLELQKPQPDFAMLQHWMKRYLLVIAMQGTLQVAIIVIMARFVTGM